MTYQNHRYRCDRDASHNRFRVTTTITTLVAQDGVVMDPDRLLQDVAHNLGAACCAVCAVCGAPVLAQEK